jgi:hypothetical protein
MRHPAWVRFRATEKVAVSRYVDGPRLPKCGIPISNSALLIVCDQFFPRIGAGRWAMPRVRRKFVEDRHFCVTHCHGYLYLVRIEIIEIAIYSVHYISLVRGERGWRVDREASAITRVNVKRLKSIAPSRCSAVYAS